MKSIVEKIDIILTEEVHEKLKDGKAFRMNLETMQLEELPEIISIPAYEVAIYSIKSFSGVAYVHINNFTDLFFPAEWLKMDHKKLLEKIRNNT